VLLYCFSTRLSIKVLPIDIEKMSLNFNSTKYQELLSEYQPKLIKTEAENEQVLISVEKLMHLSNRSREQDAIYELLIILVEKFEQEFYQPDRANNPGSMLLFLMDQRDLKASDLVGIFSSEQAVEDAISGTGHIDRSIADRLSELFHVDQALFGS
jgi:HTH-type transcriptional regulator / antitoxin HigA